MRLVFAGTPAVAIPALDALVNSEHTVVGALTREDAPLGRKRVLTPSPVAERADELGIPVFKRNRLDAEVTRWVRDLNVDLGVVVAYGGLLRRDLLDAPRHGWVNLHFSTLPRWRGAAPVQRALMAGEQQLGMSVFRLVEELDAGDIIAADAREVREGTSAGEALDTLANDGAQLLLRAVTALEHDPLIGQPQEGEPTYAQKLTREDGKLDPADSTRAIVARWAGVTPEPGAYVECNGEPLKLLDVRETSRPTGLEETGQVVLAGQRAVLTTADGAVELLRVQPAGRGAMDGAAWLRGRGGSVIVS